MRHLGYGIGHKGQTKSVIAVPSDRSNHGGGLPVHPGNMPRGDRLQAMRKSGTMAKAPNKQGGGQDSSSSSSQDEMDGESESELDDEDDVDGCL